MLTTKRTVRLGLIALFQLLVSVGYAQKYWETNFWKRFASKSDSTVLIEDHYKNGTIRTSGKLENGIPVGDWLFYNRQGTVVLQNNFNGAYTFNQTEGTKLTINGQSKNGVRSGIWEKKIYDFEGDSLICRVITDFDSGMVKTFDSRDSLVNLKTISPKKLRRRTAHTGGIYIDGGAAYYSYRFADAVQTISTLDTLQAATDKVGLSLSVGWNVANWLYLQYTFDQQINSRFSAGGEDRYTLSGVSHHLLVGTDLIKNDDFDFCPTLGLCYNDVFIQSSSHKDVANTNNIGMNFETCFRYNIINKRSFTDRGICTFALRAGYQRGFTNQHWTLHDDIRLSSDRSFSNSGFYLAAAAGFYIKNYAGK